jgi:hypothetical protein
MASDLDDEMTEIIELIDVYRRAKFHFIQWNQLSA